MSAILPIELAVQAKYNRNAVCSQEYLFASKVRCCCAATTWFTPYDNRPANRYHTCIRCSCLRSCKPMVGWAGCCR
jgi:hypothetical protein